MSKLLYTEHGNRAISVSHRGDAPFLEVVFHLNILDAGCYRKFAEVQPPYGTYFQSHAIADEFAMIVCDQFGKTGKILDLAIASEPYRHRLRA